MHKKVNHVYPIIAILLLLFACKKETSELTGTAPNIPDNVAPCELIDNWGQNAITGDSMNFFNILSTSLSNGMNPSIANSNFQANFYFTTTPSNQALTVGFYQEPTTGIYQIVDSLSGLGANEVVLHSLLGSFEATSLSANSDSLYVQNDSDKFIVSFCSSTLEVGSSPPSIFYMKGKFTHEK